MIEGSLAEIVASCLLARLFMGTIDFVLLCIRIRFGVDDVLGSVLFDVVLDLLAVLIFVFKLQLRRLGVQRVRRVRVQKQLGQKNVENVDEVVHWRPCLVDDVQAHRP